MTIMNPKYLRILSGDTTSILYASEARVMYTVSLNVFSVLKSYIFCK